MSSEREEDIARERHPTIELSDLEHLERLGVKFCDDSPIKVSKDMEQAGFVYKEPVSEEAMSPALKKKFEKARQLTKDTKVIDLRKKDAKNKSKSPASKPKKNDRKPNKAAVASI